MICNSWSCSLALLPSSRALLSEGPFFKWKIRNISKNIPRQTLHLVWRLPELMGVDSQSVNKEMESCNRCGGRLWLGRAGGCAPVGNQQLTCLANAGRVGRMSQELILFLPTALIAVWDRFQHQQAVSTSVLICRYLLGWIAWALTSPPRREWKVSHSTSR